jgi:hypothetical protein
MLSILEVLAIVAYDTKQSVNAKMLMDRIHSDKGNCRNLPFQDRQHHSGMLSAEAAGERNFVRIKDLW